MHSFLIQTHFRCNQNCLGCVRRRPDDDARFVRFDAVAKRIDEALERASGQGPAEIVLGGGEPALRPDIDRLASHAKKAGAARVVVETNGTLLTARMLSTWRQGGVDRIRLHLPAVQREAYERTTRHRGGWQPLLRGLQALGQTQMPVDPWIRVVASNVEHAADVPIGFHRAAKRWHIVLGEVFWSVPHQAASKAELAPLSRAIETVESGIRKARSVNIPSHLSADGFVPPCLFSEPRQVAAAFSLSAGSSRRPGHVHVAECDQCLLATACPGVPSRFAHDSFASRPRPIVDERLRRRFANPDLFADQLERELFQDDVYDRNHEGSRQARIVRIGFVCNQACPFCFVPTHLPMPPEQRVAAVIHEAAQRGHVVILSGGEPTLHPHLFYFLRLALSKGTPQVELQTNATRLHLPVTQTHPAHARQARIPASTSLAQALRDEGLGVAFVSLHAADAGTSDRLTGAPGTFEQSLQGIDEAVRAGLRVRLNFVFTQLNSEQFPDYVQMVASRWPSVGVTVSFVAASSDMVPNESWLVPRYSEVIPWLRKGLEVARTLGVEVGGFDSMCGIPLCLLPPEAGDVASFSTVEPWENSGEFVRAPACDECDLRDRCFGIRRRYAELYGWEEVHPIKLSERGGNRSGG